MSLLSYGTTVVSMTAVKFKPNIFYVSGFSLSFKIVHWVSMMKISGLATRQNMKLE
jgi:hypothetical protein